MNLKLKELFFIFLVVLQTKGICQKNLIVVPKLNDKYSGLVAKIEEGIIVTDYKLFRESLLTSAQYQIIINSKRIMDSLGFVMFEAAKNADYDKVISIGNAILSIDYTNMMSHKMLRQAYGFKGDSINEIKHKDIETGLLKSIIINGDGHSCLTAWNVIQVTEESFILQMLGGDITNMETNDTNLCDKFTIVDRKGKKEYFFKRISKAVK